MADLFLRERVRPLRQPPERIRQERLQPPGRKRLALEQPTPALRRLEHRQTPPHKVWGHGVPPRPAAAAAAAATILRVRRGQGEQQAEDGHQAGEVEGHRLGREATRRRRVAPSALGRASGDGIG